MEESVASIGKLAAVHPLAIGLPFTCDSQSYKPLYLSGSIQKKNLSPDYRIFFPSLSNACKS